MSKENKNIKPPKKCCYISDLSTLLEKINKAKILVNEKEIADAKWSASLSGLSTNSVKQLWITKMLDKKCINELDAIKVVTAINQVFIQYGLNVINHEKVLVCE